MKMVKQIAVLAFAALMAQCVWATAGDVISINFYQADTQKVTTDQTTVAGTIPASAWYNVNAGRTDNPSGNTVSVANLNSYNPETQASTQTTIAYSQYFSERNIRQTPDLISDAAYSYLKAALTTQLADYQGTAKVDLTTIPYAKYDVVLYFFVSASNNNAKNDGQQTAFQVSTTGTADGDYTQYTVGEDGVPTEGNAAWGRGSDRTFVLGQNTAVFTGLTSRAFHFKHQSANSGLCAIQVIDRSDAQPVKKTMNINFCQDGQKGAVAEQQLTALGMVPTSAWKNTSQGAQTARSPVTDAENGGCSIGNLLVWDGVNEAQADATKKVRFGVQQMNNLWIDTTANTTLTNAFDYLSSGLCHKVGDNFEANIYVTNDGEDFKMYDVIVYLTAANVNNKLVERFSAIQINDQWYKGDLTVEDTKTAACGETDTWGKTPVTSFNGGRLGKTAVRVNGLSGTLHIKKAAQTDCGIAAIQIVEADLEPETNAAEVDGEKYPTLHEAFAAADGKTVKLLMNQSIDVTNTADSLKVPKGVTITLDLNGHILASVATAATSSQLILNEGTLTIMDTSDTNKDGTGSGKIVVNADPAWQYDGDPRHTGSYASNGILNKGTLTIESGYLTNATSGSAAYVVDNNSSGSTANLTINGGWLYQWFVAAVRQMANSTTYENNVTINGGIVEGYRFEWIQLPGSNASVAPKAKLTVTGGELKSTQASGTQKVFYTYSYGNSRENSYINIQGGIWRGVLSFTEGVDTNNYAIQSTENIEITGGYFTEDIYTFAWWYGDDEAQAKKFIKGGCFAKHPNSSYYRFGVCPGYGVYYNEDPATMEEFPYEVREIPVVELTVTENDVPIKVREQNLAILTDDAEIVEKLNSEDQATREAAEQKVSETLHAKETNGLEVWQNYVLGINGAEKFGVTTEQATPTKIEMIPAAAPMPNSGFKVSYAMDYTDAKKETTTSDSLNIELEGENDPTGIYQVKALLTPDNGGDSIVIQTNDKIGVIKVEEATPAKKTIAVAVPFKDTTIDNLVNTALLNEGDTLMAWVDGAYATWTLSADKEWVGADVVNGSKARSIETPLTRGLAVWVTTAGKVITLGAYTDDEVEIELDEGHNLLGNTQFVETTPAAETTEQVQLIGEEEGVHVSRYNKTSTGWVSKIQTRTLLSNGKWVTTEETGTAAPTVKPGRGYWRIKPASK